MVAVEPRFETIAEALEEQIAHGRYEPSTLYGDGEVARRVADRLASLEPYVQKSLHFRQPG